ncbi:MAG: amidase [Propionibacteriales bacterium]|nr:amidase [Propionibacteriales bacterium]
MVNLDAGEQPATALGWAAAFRAGAATPDDAVDHCLGRVDALDALVGAFVRVTGDRAREAAAKATARWRAGTPASLLDGVPTAIKDLAATKGVETTFGSAAMRGHVPAFSDEVVCRIEAAGMVSLGKTNAPEFGSPCYTEPDVAPPARTPYDLDRSAGGSSGGAASAVAAGLLPVAHASDGGGSIRIPASVCGLVGFKPSRGRISSAPIYGDVTGLSTSGPMAATVRDSAAFLDVMAGPAPTDATWAAATPDGASYLQWCDRDPGRLRIARFTAPMISDVPIDPEVVAAYEDMSDRLVSLGHHVVDVELPFGPGIVAVFEKVWSVMAASWPLLPQQEQDLRPLSRWLRARGAAISGPEFTGALVEMRQAAAGALAALAPYDAVLTPTLAQPPALVGEIRNDDDPAADFEAQKAFTPYTAAWNVTGMPAVSLPTGWTTSGLPIGTMLAGKPGRDHLLYALATQVEASVEPGPRGWGRPALRIGG